MSATIEKEEKIVNCSPWQWFLFLDDWESVPRLSPGLCRAVRSIKREIVPEIIPEGDEERAVSKTAKTTKTQTAAQVPESTPLYYSPYPYGISEAQETQSSTSSPLQAKQFQSSLVGFESKDETSSNNISITPAVVPQTKEKKFRMISRTIATTDLIWGRTPSLTFQASQVTSMDDDGNIHIRSNVKGWPFKELYVDWNLNIVPNEPNKTKLSFKMTFLFQSWYYATIGGPILKGLCNHVPDAFIHEIDKIYT